MSLQRQHIQHSVGQLLRHGRWDGDACARIATALQELAGREAERDQQESRARALRAQAEAMGIALDEAAVSSAPRRKRLHPMA